MMYFLEEKRRQAFAKITTQYTVDEMRFSSIVGLILEEKEAKERRPFA